MTKVARVARLVARLFGGFLDDGGRSRARGRKKNTPNKFLDKMATDEAYDSCQFQPEVCEPLSGQSGQTLKDSGELMYTLYSREVLRGGQSLATLATRSCKGLGQVSWCGHLAKPIITEVRLLPEPTHMLQIGELHVTIALAIVLHSLGIHINVSAEDTLHLGPELDGFGRPAVCAAKLACPTIEQQGAWNRRTKLQH